MKLFVYGTLKQTAIQRVLFGRTLVATPACLDNWQCCMGAEGYLFIKPASGHNVSGQLINLTHKQLLVTDQWEEVPLYKRERLTVRLGNGLLTKAFAYTQRHASGAVHSNIKTSRYSAAREVIAARRFMRGQ